MTFVKEIVLNGPSTKMYNSRLKLLHTIFEPENCIDNVYLLNAECNISHIINSLLKEEPSCVQNIDCSNNKCRNFQKVTSSPTIILSPAYGKQILTNGICVLADIIKNYHKNETQICTLKSNLSTCNGKKTIKRTLQQHAFIELDALYYQTNNALSCELTDIPSQINIDDGQYVNQSANNNIQ